MGKRTARLLERDLRTPRQNPQRQIHHAPLRSLRPLRLSITHPTPRIPSPPLSPPSVPFRTFSLPLPPPDLVATSGNAIEKIEYGDVRSCGSGWPTNEDDDNFHEVSINFGGRLRELDLSTDNSLFFDRQVSFEGLAGLRDLLLNEESVDEERVEELFKIIGPTLERLRLEESVDEFLLHFPLLTALTHLNLSDYEGYDEVLLALPPAVSHLYLGKDLNLQPDILEWKRQPSLLPTTLRNLTIFEIELEETFEHLPQLDQRSTLVDMWRSCGTVSGAGGSR